MDLSFLYLSREDVERIELEMEEIICLVEAAFHQKGLGKVEMPPKPGIHPGGGDNFIHAMPAYIPEMGSAGIKWVSGFPGNKERGLPYITGLLILNDPETGMPLAVMDCVWITAMRTAAASAVGAKYLARPDSFLMGVLGCGVQGRTHARAMQVLFPLKKIKAYDLDPEAAKSFKMEVEADLNLDVEVVDQPRMAVEESDLIVTAGPILKEPHRTIQPGWMEEGAFASLVDFDSYWDPEALAEADLFFTDDQPQMLYYRENGYFQEIPEISGDLGQLVCGQEIGRQTPKERTMTCNLGLAMDDMAVAPTLYRLALEKEIGTVLPL